MTLEAQAVAVTESVRTRGGGATLVAQRLALAATLVLAWQAMAATLPPYVFPGPLRVLETLGRLVVDGTLPANIGVTFLRVAAGFCAAAAVGVPAGILLGSRRGLGRFFEPVLPIMNSVSSACWAIVAVIWFGLSHGTPVFVVFMTGLPLVTTNVWQGTQSVNPEWLELARSVRMPRWKVLLKVYLPAILPFFFSGARLAFGFGWRVSLVAEALGSSSGVGYMIVRAADLVMTSHVFAWTVALVTTMVALEWVAIRPVESYLFRWRKVVEA